MLQLFLGGVVVCPNIVSGISVGYTALTLPQLNYADEDSSWLGKTTLLFYALSIFVFSVVLGCGGGAPQHISWNGHWLLSHSN